MRPIVAFILVFVGFTYGCNRFERLLEEGQFERAYEVAWKQAARGKSVTAPERYRLLLAYDEVQYAYLEERDRLRRSPDPLRYVALHRLHSAAHERARSLNRLLPDRLPNRELPGERQLRKDREYARVKAGEYFEHRARQHLPAARRGDKPAARTAFALLGRAGDYLPERAGELGVLRDEAQDLGTVRLLVRRSLIDPNTDFPLPLRDRPPLLRPDNWLEVHYQRPAARVDLEADLYVDGYGVSGPHYSETCDQYSEEVLDYVEKIRKKVKINDSTYQEVVEEIKHYRTVYATVVTTTITKSAGVDGSLVVFDGPGPGPRVLKPSGGDRWRDSCESCSGDRRALPLGCGSLCSHPPSDDWLLGSAAGRFVDNVEHQLLNTYGNNGVALLTLPP